MRPVVTQGNAAGARGSCDCAQDDRDHVVLREIAGSTRAEGRPDRHRAVLQEGRFIWQDVGVLAT